MQTPGNGLDWRWRLGMAIAAAGLAGTDALAQTSAQPVIIMPAPPPNAGAPGNGPAPKMPTRPVPVGRPGDWISDDDYPRTALGNSTTGIVGFELTVPPSGIPNACEIIKSSNDAELDSATCMLLLKRAQFTPAMGADGKPATGTYRSRVLWQIPFAPLPTAGNLTIAYDILPDGNSANCIATGTGPMMAKRTADDIKAICKPWRFAKPMDAAGKPVKRHVVFETNMTISDAP